jgi:hypothetical protein
MRKPARARSLMPDPGRSLLAATLAFLVAAAVVSAGPSEAAESEGVLRLEAVPVALSETVAPGDRIGHMRFLGMLALPSVKLAGRRLSQLSALAWDEDEGVLYALSDKGTLFHLRPRFEGERLAGVTLRRVVPLRDADGKPLEGWQADAEGMAVRGGRNGRRGDSELIISFERNPHIVRYDPSTGRPRGELPLPAALRHRANYRDDNRMLESVCEDERLGVLTIPEEPLRGEQDGFMRIYSLAGESWLLPQHAALRPSDMACLGSGELLVLERDFGRLFGHTAVALRRLRLALGRAAPLTDEVVVHLRSEDGYTLDNFEGLAHHRGRRFFLVSDNNDLFFQRTLLLYIELLD